MFIKHNSVSQNMKNVDILKATSSLSNISYLPCFYDIPHPFWASLPISTFFFALLLFCPRMQNFMCSDNSETMKKTKTKRTKGACFSPVFVVAKSNCISSMLQKDNA